MELWRLVGHDGAFAGADHVASKALSAFIEVNDDFVDVSESLKLFVGNFVESHWAISDCVVVDDGDGEVDVVPEAIGVVGKWIDMLGTVGVELRLGVKLN